MKSFLRENPTIAFGLGLPLLLVSIFLLLSGIPTLIVPAPQYQLLYASQYYNYQNGLQINVINQKVQLRYLSAQQGNRTPKIWRYNPSNGGVKEIPVILPGELSQIGLSSNSTKEMPKNIIIPVPELSGLLIDSSTVAPDGYEFSLGRERYSNSHLFGSLFYSSRYRNQPVLTNNGRSIRLAPPSNRHYGANIHFIGWVIPQ